MTHFESYARTMSRIYQSHRLVPDVRSASWPQHVDGPVDGTDRQNGALDVPNNTAGGLRR